MWSYFSATAVHRIHITTEEEEERPRRKKKDMYVSKSESEPNRQNVR